MDPRSLNRYAYAHGNPVNYKDPSGHGALGAEGSMAYSRMNTAQNSSYYSTCTSENFAQWLTANQDTIMAVLTASGVAVISVLTIIEIVGSVGTLTPMAAAQIASATGMSYATATAIFNAAMGLAVANTAAVGASQIQEIATGQNFYKAAVGDDAYDLITMGTGMVDTGIIYYGNLLKPAFKSGKYSSFGEMEEDEGIRYDGYWKFQEALNNGDFKNGTGFDGWYNADGTLHYPDYYGAVPGTQEIVTLGNEDTLYVGRYGAPKANSDFVTEVGVSPDRLSLPPNTNSAEYYVYKINGSIEGAERAVIAPWAGDRGLGIQYRLPKPINWYIENGILIPQ